MCSLSTFKIKIERIKIILKKNQSKAYEIILISLADYFYLCYKHYISKYILSAFCLSNFQYKRKKNSVLFLNVQKRKKKFCRFPKRKKQEKEFERKQINNENDNECNEMGFN